MTSAPKRRLFGLLLIVGGLAAALAARTLWGKNYYYTDTDAEVLGWMAFAVLGLTLWVISRK